MAGRGEKEYFIEWVWNRRLAAGLYYKFGILLRNTVQPGLLL
jgi:hypothetical protein